MQKDVVYLGCAPAEEECAQVGSPDYEDRAKRECLAYIEAIRAVCGPEPEGAKLKIKRDIHDFGSYLEVACEYDTENRTAAEYAARCDDHAPTTWAEAGVTVSRDPGTGKRYVGERTPDGVKVVVVQKDGTSHMLDPRFDLRNHSPDGFNFGYAGSGPAQLSLALLADALGNDEQAQQVYQDYKFRVIGRVQGDRFELSQEDIQQTVAKLEAERGRRRG
jgi:hypothetical protein